MSSLAKPNLSLFLMCSHLSRSKECTFLFSIYNVFHNEDRAAKCLSCSFIPFFPMDIFKLGVCWYSLLYLSCLLVYTLTFLMNHAFTNMG